MDAFEDVYHTSIEAVKRPRWPKVEVMSHSRWEKESGNLESASAGISRWIRYRCSPWLCGMRMVQLYCRMAGVMLGVSAGCCSCRPRKAHFLPAVIEGESRTTRDRRHSCKQTSTRLLVIKYNRYSYPSPFYAIFQDQKIPSLAQPENPAVSISSEILQILPQLERIGMHHY